MHLERAAPEELRPRARRAAAFSLVEILVSLAVVAILVAASLPALASLSRGRNLTTAGNLLVGLAQQARQNAVSKNALTALVLANMADGEPGAVCLMELKELDSGGERWTATSPWQTLPSGVSVDTGASRTFFLVPDVAPELAPPNLRGRPARIAAYQIFGADGTLYVGANGQPSSSPILRLEPGTAASRNGTGDFYEITFNLLTGIPQGRRP